MRVTTFSVATTVLIAAGMAIFWPGRPAGPDISGLVAQEADPKQTPTPPRERAEGQSAVTKTLSEKLNRRVDTAFSDEPLVNVMGYLADVAEIQIYFRKKALHEAGVALDAPVTTALTQVRLSTCLELVLHELGLVYVEKDELVVITTPEDAEATLEIRVYDCRDLLAMPAPAGADKFVPRPAARTGGLFAVEDAVQRSAPAANNGPKGAEGGLGGGDIGGQTPPLSEHDLRAESLIEIVIANVDPDSWDEVGGPGSISEYNGLIVVTQTAQTHRKVERLFDMLREAAGLEMLKAGKVVR
jgi:general secretion pathway protein D